MAAARTAPRRGLLGWCAVAAVLWGAAGPGLAESLKIRGDQELEEVRIKGLERGSTIDLNGAVSNRGEASDPFAGDLDRDGGGRMRHQLDPAGLGPRSNHPPDDTTRTQHRRVPRNGHRFGESQLHAAEQRIAEHAPRGDRGRLDHVGEIDHSGELEGGLEVGLEQDPVRDRELELLSQAPILRHQSLRGGDGRERRDGPPP